VQTPAFGLPRGWHQPKSREDFAMKSLAYATLFALALTPSYGFAQSAGHKMMSDEELIKLSLSAAPEAIADFNQSMEKSRHVSDPPLRNPTTGNFGCCARAASGQATAADQILVDAAPPLSNRRGLTATKPDVSRRAFLSQERDFWIRRQSHRNRGQRQHTPAETIRTRNRSRKSRCGYQPAATNGSGH
jgi:hypothetical protein